MVFRYNTLFKAKLLTEHANTQGAQINQLLVKLKRDLMRLESEMFWEYPKFGGGRTLEAIILDFNFDFGHFGH